MNVSGTVRVVALLEAGKGMLVLAAGLGALSFMHRDLQDLAERLVGHLHLNPAGNYPRILVEFAAQLTDARLGALAALAVAYTSLRLIEAYGLWRGRRWAEWFAAVSGAVYIPFELYQMTQGDVWLSLGALLVNVMVVGLMLNALHRGREMERAKGSSSMRRSR